MSEFIQVGCMRCKRSKRNAKAAEVARKTMEDVMVSIFETASKEGKNLGVDVPEEFLAKLLKWGAKYGLFEPQPPQPGEE